jgi:hypothetical protein
MIHFARNHLNLPFTFWVPLLRNLSSSLGLKMSPLRRNNDDNPVRKVSKYKNTNESDRCAIFVACRAAMVNGKPLRGTISKIALDLGFSRATVSLHNGAR